MKDSLRAGADLSKTVCGTRLLKNVAYLRQAAPDVLQETGASAEPSAIPLPVLAQLHKQGKKIVGVHAKLAERLSRIEFPSPRSAPFDDLFQNVLYFVQLECVIFNENGIKTRVTSINDADMATAVQYATLAADPISKYGGAYGKNSITVHEEIIKYRTEVPLVSRYDSNGIYDPDTLGGWIEDIRSINQLPPGACVVILNPPGVENQWLSQYNALGYHWKTASGPYVLCANWSNNWTVDDEAGNYCLILSHEIAEMVVDPTVDGTKPEVCDPCTNVCSEFSYAAYFDDSSKYIETIAFPSIAPPKPNFAYRFNISAIVHAGFTKVPGTDCPSDPNQACSYDPPSRQHVSPTP